ncbi:MAG: hypothetical protein EXR08_10685 [Alphaproteobacteria bacterium]|nr:hypothetical protein [Alphaproteobacteria bacterium]
MSLNKLLLAGAGWVNLAGCASDLYVVLPHEDGSVGSVVVHQNGRDTVLDKANNAVKAGGGTSFTIASKDVEQRFGKALTALPPAAAATRFISRRAR